MLIEWPFPASATIEVFHLRYHHFDYEGRMQYISHCARFNLRFLNQL